MAAAAVVAAFITGPPVAAVITGLAGVSSGGAQVNNGRVGGGANYHRPGGGAGVNNGLPNRPGGGAHVDNELPLQPGGGEKPGGGNNQKPGGGNKPGGATIKNPATQVPATGMTITLGGTIRTISMTMPSALVWRSALTFMPCHRIACTRSTPAWRIVIATTSGISRNTRIRGVHYVVVNRPY